MTKQIADDVSRHCANRLLADNFRGRGGIIAYCHDRRVAPRYAKRNDRSGTGCGGLQGLLKLADSLVCHCDGDVEFPGFFQKGSPVRARKALKFIDIEVELAP